MINWKDMTIAKIVGRYGVLAVDTFSTLMFFMLQGSSWVLITTGFIFAFVKIWHFRQSFIAQTNFIKILHRGTWLIMAILSIYFLITLGLSITQTPEEEKVNESLVALEEAIASSRIANVQALTREQESLLRQNESFTERMITLNQWSAAFAPLQAQMDANLSRLGIIAEELNRIFAEQTVVDTTRLETVERESSTLVKFQPVKPIGAPNLMGRVIPESWINLSIIILFTLIGIGMEITLALSSLPAELKNTSIPNIETDIPIVHPIEPLPEAIADNEPITELAAISEDGKDVQSELPKERKGYSAEEILAYIDIACHEDKLMPDHQVGAIPESDCAGIRDYLQSFKFKSRPIVEFVDRTYRVNMDKDKLKKFISLQCNTQRVFEE